MGRHVVNSACLLMRFGCKFGCIYNKSLTSRLYCGEDEIRTRGRDCSLRRFSKPVVSATHPPLLESGLSLFLRRKVNAFFRVVQIFIAFIRGRLIFCGSNTHVCSELGAVNIFDVIAASLRLCLKLVKIWRIGK